MKRRSRAVQSTLHQPATPPSEVARVEMHQWLLGLRLRPFVWLCPAIAAGCALGVQWARVTNLDSRDEWILWYPLLLSALCGMIAWQHRARSFSGRAWFFTALLLFCVTQAARRVLPPAADISHLVESTVSRAQPLKSLNLELRGRVVDEPRRSEFGQTFVLECELTNAQSTLRGRIWVEAPREAGVQQNDRLQLRAALMDLPQAGHASERERHWRYILNSCWCRARVEKARDLRVLNRSAAATLSRRILHLRRAILERFQSTFIGGDTTPRFTYPRATAQLLTAMTFGEGGLSEPLPTLTRDAFRAAGLSHVLVASGTQISFVAVLLIGLCRLIGVRGGWMLLVIAPCLMAYALLAGSAPSIWRATIVGICVCGAIASGRENDGLSLWSLALGILLLLDPISLFDLSLQLTFGATWGLIVLSPILRDLVGEGLRLLLHQRATDDGANDQASSNKRVFEGGFVNVAIALSLSAQMGTLPIVAYHFGRISLAGFGANLLGVPLAGMLVFGGLAGLVIAPINLFNYWLTRAMSAVAFTAASVPGAQLEARPLSLGWTILCYIVFVCALLPFSMRQNIARRQSTAHRFGRIDWASLLDAARDEMQRALTKARDRWHQSTLGRSPRAASLVALGLLSIVGVLLWWRARTAPLLVAFLDVGQGECIIVKSPSGRVLLVDGGSLDSGRGDVGRGVIVPYLQSIGAQRIDVLALTHADADHCNALFSVAREVPTANFLNGVSSTQSTLVQSLLKRDSSDATAFDYQDVRRAMHKSGATEIAARAGQLIDLGDGPNGRVSVRVLAPLAPPLPGENDNGLVLRLEYGAVSFLLTADIEAAAENRLLRRGREQLRCTVLKAAHHGSKTSSSVAFLKAAQPKIAVISCGRYNRFGHPAPSVLQRLQDSGAQTFRTDLDGAVEITSDGRSCWVQTQR